MSAGGSGRPARPVEILPMFPLALVLLPGGVVPLRLFEARYLRLYQDILRGDRRFGIVLIERGADTGGHDTRFGTGCIARMVGSVPQEDGTILTVNVGTARLRVLEWLEDDPYPRAVVERLEEAPVDRRVEEAMARCRAHLTTVRALTTELGADVGEEPELSDDPVRATFQIAALSPIAVLDRQRILELDDPLERVSHLSSLLADLADTLRLQLEMGD